MKKIITITVLSLLGSAQLLSQSRLSMSYSIAFPMGDLGDYIQPASFRGVAMDFHDMVNENVGLGFSTGWNIFYSEEDKATYEIDNSSVTGKQYRYSNNVPIMFSAAYYFKPKETLDPFASIGIGTSYTRRDTDMGILTFRQEAWNFLLAPQIGVLYDLSRDNAFSVALQYYHGFQGGSELDEAQSYLAIKLGFEFR